MDSLSDIRAVCWDWNGTLLDVVEICLQVMNDLLIEHGECPLVDAHDYRSLFRFPLKDFYRDVGIGDEHFEAAVTQYLSRLAVHAGESRLHPYARQTLGDIAGTGIRQVLASATLPDLLELQMAPHGVSGAFERILAIDDPYRASKRDVIEDWLAGSGLPAAYVLLIGDTNHDREIADELGAHFVHFAAGHQAHGGRGLSISALDELPRLLRSAGGVAQ